MNPIAYRMKPEEPLRFLLIGEMVSYRDGKEPERVWNLNIYSSAKSRKTAEKKMKRHSSDSIFIEWDMTMGKIVQQGKLVFPIASDKVLITDKMDIWKQLSQQN